MNKNFFNKIKRSSFVINNIIKRCGANQRVEYKFLPINTNNITTKILNNALNYQQEKIKKKRNIEFLIDLKNYKGIRHRKHLPVRGQRTRTNAQTSKKKL